MVSHLCIHELLRYTSRWAHLLKAYTRSAANTPSFERSLPWKCLLMLRFHFFACVEQPLVIRVGTKQLSDWLLCSLDFAVWCVSDGGTHQGRFCGADHPAAQDLKGLLCRHRSTYHGGDQLRMIQGVAFERQSAGSRKDAFVNVSTHSSPAVASPPPPFPSHHMHIACG